ncbi:putative aarF domain-containing protein kinase 2 isoform X1 [Mustelus asterias]
MATFLFICRIPPAMFRPMLRATVLISGSPALKASFRLRKLPKLTLACLGLGASSVANSQKMVTVEAKVLHRPNSRAARSFLKVLFWKLHFTVHVAVRAVILLLRFGPLLLLYPVCFASSNLTLLWCDLLLKSMEAAGPTFIKLGQWFSTRRDLFSAEFCDKFSRLHVHVTPHSWGYTEYSMKRAFGEGWKNIFQFENKEPIRSGCIAHVYRAYSDPKSINNSEFQKFAESFEKEDQFEAWEVFGLQGIFHHMFGKKQNDFPDQTNEDGHHDPQNGSEPAEEFIGIPEPENGKATLHPESTAQQHSLIPVAIKVMHPGIVHRVKMDLLLMKASSWVLDLLPGLKWLRWTEVVGEFERLMTRLIDLRYEAKNLERFRENFQDMESVKFPIPLRPFVTRTVLVETFEESEPISMYLTKDVPKTLKERLARVGVEMLLKMVFVDNFIHGDLHPGNILIQGVDQFSLQNDDKTTIVDLCDTLIVNVHPSQCPLKLILLDTGIVTELQPADLHNFKAIFTAVIEGQGEQVAELLLTQARTSECRDIQLFKSEIEKLFSEAKMKTGSLGELHIASLLSQVLETLLTHKIKVQSNFASIIFAFMVLEDLSRSLNPRLDLLEVARPLLLKNTTGVIRPLLL